jgi:hypothetical protein
MPDRASQRLQALTALWEESRMGKSLPARADLPVLALRPWLGSLAIFEFRPDVGPVFRLCGTGLYGRFGGEVTGKPVSELEPAIAHPVRQELESAIGGGKPRYSRHTSGDSVFQELYLPLAGNGGGAEFVLFASYAEERP